MSEFRALMVLFVTVTFVTFQGCATGSSTISPAFYETDLERIALVSIGCDIRGEVPKNQVEDFFTMEMIQKGYRVIERSRVASLLEEQDFQHSEATTQQEAVEMGRILNVSGVVMLDVSVVGEKVTLTGRMLDPETGEVLWIGTGRGGSGRTLATLAGAAVGATGGYQVARNSRAQNVASIAGGVIGGAAGYGLAPQAARVVQNAIKEMVQDLPSR